MALVVDARGLACPQPVILTRNAMREAEEITTLVTGRDQVDNVQRLAERAGWQTRLEPRPDGYALHLSKQAQAVEPELTPDLTVCSAPLASSVVALTSDRMGRGENELGSILMRSFMYTLTQIEPRPRTLVLYNTGVRLAIQGSPVLDDLLKLAVAGVEILVCGTCLGYLEIKDQLAVGEVSNMYSIAETLLAAGNAVTI
jgi:selenium metabolism protein YedF